MVFLKLFHLFGLVIFCVEFVISFDEKTIFVSKLLNNVKVDVIDDEIIQPTRYDGSQLWRLILNDNNDRKTITELENKFDCQKWMDNGNNVDILFNSNSLLDAEQILKSSNLSHVVLIDDLQKQIENENPPKEEIENLQNRKGHRMTWNAYHRVSEIHGYLDYLAKTYPDLCTTQTIGHSSFNRPLKLIKISNGHSDNRAVWIDGGIHAREWISPASVTYIIERLTENWDDLPKYLKNIDWYILPVVNPDGYEHTHQYDRLWRKNRAKSRGGNQCAGVDLNRNFGYKWGGKGTSSSSCSEIYRGSKAFSEPESLAMSNYMTKFGKGFFKAYLTYHSYGQYILFPWGHERLHLPDHREINRVAKEGAANILKVGGAKYTVGAAAETLYPAAGGSDDWAKAILDVKYTYTVEMRDTGRYGFVLPANQIEVNGKEGFAFVETVAKAVANI